MPRIGFIASDILICDALEGINKWSSLHLGGNGQEEGGKTGSDNEPISKESCVTEILYSSKIKKTKWQNPSVYA